MSPTQTEIILDSQNVADESDCAGSIFIPWRRVPGPAPFCTLLPLWCRIVWHNCKFSKVTTSDNTLKLAEWRFREKKGRILSALLKSEVGVSESVTLGPRWSSLFSLQVVAWNPLSSLLCPCMSLRLRRGRDFGNTNPCQQFLRCHG